MKAVMRRVIGRGEFQSNLHSRSHQKKSGKMTMEENDHQKTEIVRLREEKKKRKVVLQETKNKLKAEVV